MTTILDNIILGSYTFTINPQQFSVNYTKMKTNRRSLNGTLQSAYVVDGNGKTIKKREITISGISDDQLDDLLAQFEIATDLSFTDIYNNTYNVQFVDFNYNVDAQSVNYPNYSITLSEV